MASNLEDVDCRLWHLIDSSVLVKLPSAAKITYPWWWLSFRVAGVEIEVVLTACSQFLKLRVDPFAVAGTVSVGGKQFQSYPDDNGVYIYI